VREVAKIRNVLCFQMPDKSRLACSRLTEQNEAFRPAILRDPDAGTDWLAIHDARPDIERALVHRSRAVTDPVVPEACDMFFEKIIHRSIFVGDAPKSS